MTLRALVVEIPLARSSSDGARTRNISLDSNIGRRRWRIQDRQLSNGTCCRIPNLRRMMTRIKTRRRKLDLKNMECKDLINEAAKIIYMVHDEVKDKMFELELSWVTKYTM